MTEKMTAEKVLDLFAELTNLTRIKRTGWILTGVREPESIADHCYETAIFAYVLAKQMDLKVDMSKVLLMSLFHEVGEVRITDFPRRAKKYVKKFKKSAELEAFTDIIGSASNEIVDLFSEFDKCETIEAKLAEAAEELQIIFKALMYAKENNGDISEYRIDVDKYNSQGFDLPQKIAEVIKEKLNNYLGDKEYWKYGYTE